MTQISNVSGTIGSQVRDDFESIEARRKQIAERIVVDPLTGDDLKKSVDNIVKSIDETMQLLDELYYTNKNRAVYDAAVNAYELKQSVKKLLS